MAVKLPFHMTCHIPVERKLGKLLVKTSPLLPYIRLSRNLVTGSFTMGKFTCPGRISAVTDRFWNGGRQ